MKNPVPDRPEGKRREQQKAETRQLILESARALFETVGYEKATMRTVAAHAGIGLGTTYKHFANKAALLSAALADDLGQLHAKALASVPVDGALKEQFVHIARHFYAYYTSRPSLARAYLANLFSLGREEMAVINAFDESFVQQVTRLVSAAQASGEISADRDSQLVTEALMAAYFYVLGNCFMRYYETDTEKMLSVLSRMLDQIVP